jgi:prepilin peptidase CpaA
LIQTVADVTLTVIVSAAAWYDVTTHRIPNWLTVSGLVLALLLRFLGGSLGLGLQGSAVAFGISLVLYLLRAVGAGDVKLLAAVGAFFGSSEVAGALAVIAIAGAGFALLNVIYRGVLPLLLLNTYELLKSWRTLGGERSRTLDSPGALTIPYGVPIAAGTLFWWFGQGVRL